MAGRLIAIDLPGGEAFVTALRSIWDDGDAALPLDQRLPAPARERLLAEVRPHAMVTAGGSIPVDDAAPATREGDALVMATSGTTGTPRGVVLTHDAVAASAHAASTRLGVGPDDIWLACLPLGHVGGLAVVTRALVTGTRLVVHPSFDARAAESSGATLTSLVATALSRIDPTRFRAILLGGGPAPSERPSNCVTTYGMTETGSGVVYDGRPLDGVELRTRTAGVSEILVRAPMLLRAYRTPVGDTDPPFEDGWFATGDLGTIDAAGVLSVHGRAGELIISGGQNIWPQAVERVLATAPGVDDVAVGPVPDPEWGQAVTAYVVPEIAGQPPSLASLRDHVREQLPAYCAPRHMVVVTSIPRTSLGKIARHRLPTPPGTQ